MKNKTYDCAIGCPVEATLDVIGGKWKAVVLYHLMSGTLRFNEIRKRLNGITQRMLTKQLRELEGADLIARKVYPVVPPRVEYSLTKKGLTLRPVIRALEVWGGGPLNQQGKEVQASRMNRAPGAASVWCTLSVFNPSMSP